MAPSGVVRATALGLQGETMQSNNPVFRRSEGFNKNAYGNATYAGNGQAYSGYGSGSGYSDPSTWGTGTPGAPARTAGPMTIDSVVQKTAIALGVVIVTALATWILTPSLDAATVNLGPIMAAVTGGALGGISKLFDATYGGGVVSGAVIGTFAAFAGTLAAYKFFDIKVGNKFRTVVTAAVFGMIGLSLME